MLAKNLSKLGYSKYILKKRSVGISEGIVFSYMKPSRIETENTLNLQTQLIYNSIK